MSKSNFSLLYDLLITLFIMSISSCSGQEPEYNVDDDEYVSLSISYGIGGMANSQSRAIIQGGVFPSGTDGANAVYQLGTWVCLHEDSPQDFQPVMFGYNNILTRLTASGNGNNYTTSSTFTIDDYESPSLNISRHKAVDIYSYYPYHSGKEYNDLKPNNVPFSCGEDDWMWGKTSIREKELEGSEVSANINYTHAMTCIRVIINAKYNGTTISSIKLHDSKGRLYTEGIMNIASQKLILDEKNKTDELTITYNRNLTKGIDDECFIIMPPLDNFIEGDLTMSFSFNGKDGVSTFIIPSKMSNNQTVDSFKQGYCYTYRLELDNSLTFSPIDIDETWKTNDYSFFL